MSSYYASKAVEIAVGEIGYHEKNSASNLEKKTASNDGSGNYTKYSRDLYYAGFYNGSKQGYAWCDVWVDWVLWKLCGENRAEAEKLNYQTGGTLGAGCTYSAGYYKKNNAWFTNPKVGDQIFFGKVGNEEHTGIVEKVDSSYVYTIEGNYNNQVTRRSYNLGNSYIAGYGRPKYDEEPVAVKKTIDEIAKEVIAGKWGVYPARKTNLEKAGYNYSEVQTRVNEMVNATKWTPKVGDIVIYNGTTHYTTANSLVAKKCKGGKAKITSIYNLGKSKHPYHLIRVSGSGATVYGWVNDGTFKKA